MTTAIVIVIISYICIKLKYFLRIFLFFYRYFIFFISAFIKKIIPETASSYAVPGIVMIYGL